MDSEVEPVAPTLDPLSALEAIRAGKLVNASQLLVCEVMARATEPMTRSEIAQQITTAGHQISASGVGSRTGELVQLGVLRELAKRPCRVSKISVATFESTGRLPAKEMVPMRFTRRQILRALKTAHSAVDHLRAVKTAKEIAAELGVEEAAVAASIEENLAACNGLTPEGGGEGEDSGEEKLKRSRKSKAAATVGQEPAETTSGTAPEAPATTTETPAE